MGSVLRPIETLYRGYRFRSRTEARYAVLFDTAGIAWQYELEGFVLNGTRYLPDFYLPELKTYVEVKPTMEAARQGAPLLWALKQASGCEVFFAISSPTVEPPDNFYTCMAGLMDGLHVDRAPIRQCSFCTRLHFNYGYSCPCAGDVRILRAPQAPLSRLIYALGEAQRARFEWGETPRPRPYTHPPATGQLHVYAAGAIFCEAEFERKVGWVGGDQLDPWRTDIFGCEADELNTYTTPKTTIGRFVYAGPTIVEGHGLNHDGLAQDCLAEVAAADALFVWLDREDTIGTLVEIGAAYAARKPIFIAFAAEELAEHFYFAQQLATAAVITADVKTAWDLFTRWQTNT